MKHYGKSAPATPRKTGYSSAVPKNVSNVKSISGSSRSGSGKKNGPATPQKPSMA